MSEIHGNLTLSNLPNLNGVYAFSQLTRVEGKLTLQGLPFVWLSLSSLQNVGELSVSDMPNLYYLDGLEGLTAVTGNVSLARLGVYNLLGLRNVTFIGGNLILNSLNSLDSLPGLEALTSVGNAIRIENNAHLSSISELRNVTHLQEFSATNNPVLSQCALNDFLNALHLTCSSCSGNNESTPCPGGGGGCLSGSFSLGSPADVQGLAGVYCINGDITVPPETTLTDFAGLESLKIINGNLTLSYTPIVSMHGLENLTTVTGSIRIESNSALTSVNALSALASAGEFRVFHNTAITEASVPALKSVGPWYLGDNQNLPQCWSLVLEQQLAKGCSNCAYSNHGNGACPAPVDGWIDQSPYSSGGYYSGGYIITFANGGGTGTFSSIADAHAAYPNLVLAEPVYDGEVVMYDVNWYGMSNYSGGGMCCYNTAAEVISGYPQLLLRPLQ